MKFNERYNCYVSKNGLVYRYDKRKDKLKLLSQSHSKPNSKYMRVGVIDSHDNKMHSVKVHRLVYMTFVGEIPEGMQIDHIDGDASNNNLENLRCVSPKENSNNPNTVWKIKGENNGMFGRHHSIESRRKMSINKLGTRIPQKSSRWSKYGMTRRGIEEKLNLCRTQVEKLDKENKLMEVLTCHS